MADRLSEAHRLAQLALRADVLRQLVKLWPAMNWDDLDGSFRVWLAATAPLIVANHRRSTALAVAYLSRHRAAYGPQTPFQPVPAPALELARIETAAGATALAGTKAAAARGVMREQAMGDAFVRSTGAATRLVMAGGRDTITATAKADPAVKGYERVTSGNPCDFCSGLAGLVLASNADFQAHDHCGCSSAPVYG
jgi:hypothetical protein